MADVSGSIRLALDVSLGQFAQFDPIPKLVITAPD
jgi:hypothetical protein